MLAPGQAHEKTARLLRAAGCDPAQRSLPKLVASGRELRFPVKNQMVRPKIFLNLRT